MQRWFEEAQVRKGWSKATVYKYDKAIRRLQDRFRGKLSEINKR